MHVIIDRAQAAAIVSPVRLEIVDRLAALGPLTVRQLAAALHLRPTAIYRHLNALEQVGLVMVERESFGPKGRPSIVYRAIAKRIGLGQPTAHPEITDLLARIVDQSATVASQAYKLALQKPADLRDGVFRNHAFFSVVSAPSKARLRRINKLLEELAELAWTPDDTPGQKMRFTWLVSPIDSGGGKKSK